MTLSFKDQSDLTDMINRTSIVDVLLHVVYIARVRGKEALAREVLDAVRKEIVDDLPKHT